jgi:hypothetical protein
MNRSILAGAALAAVLPFCAATAAHAAADAPPQGTLELGYTRAAWDTDPSIAFNTIHARGSLQANKNFGAEMELGFGFGSDSIPGGEIKQQVEAGLYVDGYLPVGHGDLIARVGWTRTVTRATATGGGSTDFANKGAALGVGYRFFPNGGENGVRVDYTHYFYDGDIGVNAVSIGYVRKF